MTFLATGLMRMRRTIRQRALRRFLTDYRAAISDIGLRLLDLATLDTATYVQPRCRWFSRSSPGARFATSPPRSPDEGVVLEFGVFWGATVNHLTRTG